MKKLLKHMFLSLASILMGWYITSCQNNSSSDPSPSYGCRLESYSINLPGPQNSFTEKATYTYDSKGNLIKADTIRTGKDSFTESSFNYISQYSYDEEGYLTAYTSDWNIAHKMVGGNVEKKQQAVRTTFTYTDGRLHNYSSKSVGSNGLTMMTGLTMYTTGALEYNLAGDVVKWVITKNYEYDPDVVQEVPLYTNEIHTYIYADNLLIDYIFNNGTTEIHPATIVNGLIVKTGNEMSYNLFEFDEQERPIKTAIYTSSNTLNSYYTEEWDKGRSALSTFPVFKGFPSLKLFTGKRDGLKKKFSYYADAQGQGIELMGEITFTNELHANGLVKRITSQSKNLNADGTYVIDNDGAGPVFTYTGCQ